MSQPQTSAKCIIYTTKGRLDVELWAKEIPISTKTFLEACSQGKLKGETLCEIPSDRLYVTISNIKNDYQTEKLPEEHNSRIRFNRNGIVGWDNVSLRWFITTKEWNANEVTPAMTIIGKIVDESIYTFKRIIDDSELDANGKFVYPATIEDVEVTIPYFTDLTQSSDAKVQTSAKNDKSTKYKKATKVKLSYHYDEDDDDNEETRPTKKMKIRLPASIIRPIETGPGTETEPEPESGQTNIDDHQKTLNDRERETLEMLAKFKKQTKGKAILKRGENNDQH